MHFIYKSCSWLTKLAFYLQTVHLILQTCISLTIVAVHFSNVASRFTIKHIFISYVDICAFFAYTMYIAVVAKQVPGQLEPGCLE